jgi:predicted transcriptional regulator
VSIYHYSFVCLRHVVQVSMHYRLCIVTVRMKVLQNGRLVRFSERLAGASVTKRATLLGVSTAAVSIVMTAYTNHRKTSSATKTSGRKPKLTERNRRTMKRIMSKHDRTTTAKVTPELIIHLVDSVRREIHKSNIHGRTAISKPLIT